MMLRSFFISLLIIKAHLCGGQKLYKMPAMVAEGALYGKVKSVTTIYDTLHDKHYGNPFYGPQYIETDYYSFSGILDSSVSLNNMGIIYKKYCRYNKKGNKTIETTFRLRNDTLHKYEEQKYFYKQGNISKMTHTLHNRFKTIIYYNEQGDQTEIDEYTFHRESGKRETDTTIEKIKNTYDDKGMLYEAVYYFADTAMDINRYKYDNDTNIIEVNSLSADGKDRKRTKYVYDGKKRIIEWTSYASGKFFYHCGMDFDLYGNLKEYIEYKEDGSPLTKTHTDYEYDKEGNWIKKTWLSKKGEIVIDTRFIEYY